MELAKENRGGGFTEFNGYSSNTRMSWDGRVTGPNTEWNRFWVLTDTSFKKAVAYVHIVFNSSTADYILGKMDQEVSAPLADFTLSMKLTLVDGQIMIYYKASKAVGGFGSATIQAAIIGMD